jgi:hypothetical protein
MRRVVVLGTVLTVFCLALTARAQTEQDSVDVLREALELLTRQVQRTAAESATSKSGSNSGL